MNDDSPHTETQSEGPSNSQRKRDAADIHQLGRELVALSPDTLRQIPLDGDLETAITEAQQIRAHGALKRQLQFIAKLLRQRELDDIRQALDDLDQQSASAKAAFKRCEQWRDRLIDEEPGALEDFIRQWPETDRQQLRQLIRNAIKERQRDKPPSASRALFRYIRDLTACP
ncbi:MAG TPA: ribosome-associated protein [Gammaproteobacteria bacterium]|nr:ribosome-associated protein [Gammaproteobacteria bacterium]